MMPRMTDEGSATPVAPALGVQEEWGVLRDHLGRAARGLDDLTRFLLEWQQESVLDQLELSQLRRACRNLGNTIDALVDAPEDQAKSLAVAATASWQAMDADIENLQEQVDTAAFLSKGSARHQADTIMGSIKRALGTGWKHLWALISRILTVKEWSVTGTAGSGFLGFASATITVTFG
jgi:hypothetical protein